MTQESIRRSGSADAGGDKKPDSGEATFSQSVGFLGCLPEADSLGTRPAHLQITCLFCGGVIFRSPRVTKAFPVGSEDPPGTKLCEYFAGMQP